MQTTFLSSSGNVALHSHQRIVLPRTSTSEQKKKKIQDDLNRALKPHAEKLKNVKGDVDKEWEEIEKLEKEAEEMDAGSDKDKKLKEIEEKIKKREEEFTGDE